MKKKFTLLVGQILLHAKVAGFCVFFSLTSSALLFFTSSHISPTKLDVEFLILDSNSNLYGAELDEVRRSVASLGVEFGGKCNERRPADLGVHYTFCQFAEANPDKAYDQFISLTDSLKESGFSVSNIRFEDSTELSFPPWLLLLYIILHVPVVRFALREVAFCEDAHRAVNEITARPWWLLVPLAVGVVISSLVYVLLTLSFGSLLQAESEVLQQDLITQDPAENQSTLLLLFFLNAIVLAPIWEEAVFRGWLYERRAEELRLLVRAGINGWFFAGAHSMPYLWSLFAALDGERFSPTLFYSWVTYLITILCFGMLFYFIREKKNSVSLVVVLHLVQNLFSFSVLLLLLP